ncbi:MAG: hypothetical protein JNJ58_07625 [Chitinophagaceae bacterium]|nr:hypothetical protein [Chitinophagaceae bacterium]
MKKILLFTMAISITFVAMAQNKKVALHHLGTTSLYSSNSGFADAITAAVNGDTIYLPGGYWNPPVSINKKLVIYGAGHYPDSTQATEGSHIVGTVTFEAGSDSTLFQGIEVSGDINFNGTPISYVHISRCAFGSSTHYGLTDHISYTECVVRGSLNPNNLADFLHVRNSIIVNVIQNILQGALIENNIFTYQNCCWYSAPTFAAVNGSLIRNNVILNTNIGYEIGGNCSNNLIQHNLFVTNPVASNNTLSGNYMGVASSSVFVNFPAFNVFNYSDDYHLQSPATYLGTDGSELGIYGGSSPAKEAAVPANPHIRINNTAQSTDVNGNLQIDIQVGAQDH